MRTILVDHARSKEAVKRGGTGAKCTLADDDLVAIPDPGTLLDVDAALTRLDREDPAAVDVARMRGKQIEELV